MFSDIIVSSLIIASVTAIATALATGFISGKIMEARLQDLTDRIKRIEHFLNGILLKHDKNVNPGG
jgi:hypothetical protein